MGAGDAAKFFRRLDAGEGHEIPDRVFVGAPGRFVGQIGESFDFRRHVGQAQKIFGGESRRFWETVWIGSWGGGGGHGVL